VTGANTLPLDELARQIHAQWTDLDTAETEALKAYDIQSAAEVAFREACEAANRVSAATDDLRLKVGALLAEARKQCKHGTWKTWFEEHIKGRIDRDARRLIELASAGDPKAAREEEKRKNREAQQRSRNAKRTDTSAVSPISTTAPQPTAEVWSEQAAKVIKPSAPAAPAPPAAAEPEEDKLAVAKAAVEALSLDELRAFAIWFEHRCQDGSSAVSPDLDLAGHRLFQIYREFKPNTKKWATKWIEDECPVDSYPDEPITVTEALSAFRAVATGFSPEQRQRFLAGVR